MFVATFLLLFATQLIVAQKCLHHMMEENSLECWELTPRTDFSSYNLASVTQLLISSSNLTYLDGRNFESFERLAILMMSGNNIKSFADDTFRELEHLHYLDLSFNDIEYLNPTTFATNAEIAAIDLTGNQLTLLHVDMFKSLPLLKIFNLEGNPIDYCEINTHFALLELRFRNIDTHVELQGCKNYYEMVPRKLEVQISQLIEYLNIFNALTLLLLSAVFFALFALILQSKKTGGWKFPITALTFTRYNRLKDFPETKLPQAV